MAESPAVKKWLNAVNEKTAKGYLWHFDAFLKWMRINGGKFKKMSPDKLVEFILDGGKRQENEILDLKKEYLLSLKGRSTHKGNANKTLNSFFAHNRVPLPRDTTLRLRGDTPKVVGTLTPQNVRDVVIKSNILYKAAFLCMLQSGLGQNEFLRWSNSGLEDLRKHLKDDCIKIVVEGRKSDRNEYQYYTFVAGDSLIALRKYMAERDKGKFTDRPQIFLNSRGEALTQVALYRYWNRKLVNLGIKNAGGWQGTNIHELRDVFRTLWRKSSVDVAFGEYFMGHRGSLDQYGYDKTAEDVGEMKRKYLEALPILNIMSENRPLGLVSLDEVEQLRKEHIEMKERVDLLESITDRLTKEDYDRIFPDEKPK